MTGTLKIAQLLYGYLVALNKINTFVIYSNIDLIQHLKGLVCFYVLIRFCLNGVARAIDELWCINVFRRIDKRWR
ncbi:hypothetical protein VCR3J2_80260 [Vibrio coralliirubri]|nr:hypothetical protein VCR3J2_80260 [Vibrio coralliirubri]